MATKAATYLAFQSIVRRTLATSTPTRAIPRPRQLIIPRPHQPLASHATKARQLSKNHFTSHPPQVEGAAPDAPPRERKEAKNKRKVAQRQSGNTSLRRVAVEAQRSRATPLKGFGRTRHVDPDVETKDVTAYCAAEQYQLDVARDILSKEGYRPDPCNTQLFPQVLHVQTPPSWSRGSGADGEGAAESDAQKGDIFVFPSGTVVVWNVADDFGHHLVERLLAPAAEGAHPGRLEVEDLEYVEDATREHSKIVGDTIILGTKPSSDAPTPTATTTPAPPSSPPSPATGSEVDTTLAKIAFSSALARSTKLAVLENALAQYMHSTRSIPASLTASPSHPVPSEPTQSITRGFVLRKTGELLSLRATLNLYSELTDSLPDLFWDSPHELGLEDYYDEISRVLDVDIRIKLLNEKMDYASEIAAVLRERLGEQHGHRLEWIIIWLIVCEVLFGCWHIYRELAEQRDPDSSTNLAKAWYLKELEKGKVAGEKGGSGGKEEVRRLS